MPQEIKLYRMDGTCSFAPHALLRHLGVPFQEVKMTMGATGVESADGSLTRAEYIEKIHPGGHVPGLTVDGRPVSEMPAVMTQIALLAPDREAGLKLLGQTDLDRVEIAHWVTWLSGVLHGRGFNVLWRPDLFAGNKTEYYPVIKEKGTDVIAAAFERIDKKVKGKKYVVGDCLTIADFNLYFFWRWGSAVGMKMAELYPNYGNYLKGLEKLDAIKKTMEVEGFPLYF